MPSKYYRKITERLPQNIRKILSDKGIKEHLARYGVFLLSVIFVFLAACLVFTYFQYGDVLERRLKDSNNLVYWEEVAKKQENSPDVYYEAAFYSARVGDRQKAMLYIGHALKLDPEFEKAKEFSQELLKTAN